MKKQIIINEEILWDYIDGLLSESEQEAVEVALRTSDKWNPLLDKVQAEKAFLTSAVDAVPSPDFSMKIMQTWEAEQAVTLKKQTAKSNLLRWIFTVMGALLLASLCVFFYGVIQNVGALIQMPFSVQDIIAQPTYWYVLLFFTLISVSYMMEEWDLRKWWAVS